MLNIRPDNKKHGRSENHYQPHLWVTERTQLSDDNEQRFQTVILCPIPKLEYDRWREQNNKDNFFQTEQKIWIWINPSLTHARRWVQRLFWTEGRRSLRRKPIPKLFQTSCKPTNTHGRFIRNHKLSLLWYQARSLLQRSSGWMPGPQKSNNWGFPQIRQLQQLPCPFERKQILTLRGKNDFRYYFKCHFWKPICYECKSFKNLNFLCLRCLTPWWHW